MIRNTYKIILALILLLISSNITLGQGVKNEKQATTDEDFKIEAICRNYGDSIVVRWAPNSPVLWLLNNKAGYMVDRLVKTNGKTEYKPVRTEPFKPLSKEAMIARYKNEKHPYGMVATQFLYGEVDLSDGKQGIVADITNKTEEQNMRYGYSLQAADFDPNVADALGLRYVFYPKQSNDTTFTFRVRSLLTNEKVKPGWCGVDKGDVFKNEKTPRELKAKALKNGARLFWMRNTYFSAYYIERSADGKNFKQLNDKPFLTSHMKENEVRGARITKIDLPKDSLGNVARPSYMQAINLFEIYQDSLPNNNQMFYYRVRGLDAFGQVSPPSKRVMVKGIPPLDIDAPYNVKVIDAPNRNLKITWKNGKKTAGLKGLIVSTSRSIKGQRRVLHKGLLPLNTTSVIDDKVKKGGFNMYFVSAVDTLGNYYNAQPATGRIADITPPAVPKNVEGVFDATGMSLITWDKNTEEDVKGYKVYRRFNPKASWMQITELPIADPYIFDVMPLETLTRNVYYSVIAVDYSGNHSEYSKQIKVEIPDIVPPTRPVVDSYRLTNEKVIIVYIGSSSNDVKGYNFYRKEKKGDWKLLKYIEALKVKDGKIKVEDNTIETNVNYTYAMCTVDKSGLKSKLSTQTPILLRNRGLEELDFNLKVSQQNKDKLPIVVLEWQKTKFNKKKFHYVLYKKIENGYWKMVKTFNKNKVKGTDKEVTSGKRYEYKLAIYANGGKVAISKPVNINIK